MSQYGQPVITQAYYLNPWLPLPPGWPKNGIDVSVNPPANQPQVVLAGRLRQGPTTLLTVVGLVPTEVLMSPPTPLSALLDYAVDVQWVAQGSDPNSISWTDPSAIATTPILSDSAQLASAAISSGKLAFEVAYGAASLPPAGVNVMVFDQDKTSAGFIRVQGNSGILDFAPQAGSSYSVYVQPVMPVAGTPLGEFKAPFSAGPIGNGLLLPTPAPVIDVIDYDGSTLRVTWAMPEAWKGPPPSGGVLQLLSSGDVLAEAVVGNGVGSIEIVLDGSWSTITVQVRAVFGSVIGPFSATVTPWLAGVHPVTTATDAISGKATLSWPATAQASGYIVNFSDGRPPATTTTASYALGDALAANASLQVSVRAVFESSTLTSRGAPGPWTPVPSSMPALIDADYDGTQVSASWAAIDGAGGYVVSLVASGATTPVAQHTVAAGVTSASFTASITDPTKTYTVTVQATGSVGTGLAAAGMPIYSTGFGISSAAPSTAPPYLFPAASIAQSAQTLILYLPDLALPGQTITMDAVGAFALAANTDGGTQGALPYMLTIAATSEAWIFSKDSQPLPSIRTQLQTDYIAFLKAAETAHASPWGIWMLQQAIARFMPQTFAETLYYAYGLNLGGGPGTGTIDLRPGMILRVDFAGYNYVWTSAQNNWLNGFAGNSRLEFEIGDFYNTSAAWTQGMDAFVAQLVSAGVMSVPPPPSISGQPQQAGVADAADLFYPGFPQPFYRLFFPRSVLDPSGTGSTTTSSNFSLVSAASYTQLSTATTTPSASSPVAFFRGRAVVTACIRISVNGNDVVVPIGTTLGNVLDRYAARPPASALHIEGLTWERALGAAIPVYGSGVPSAAVMDVANRYRIRIDWKTLPVYAAPQDATTLPLLHGDRLSFATR